VEVDFSGVIKAIETQSDATARAIESQAVATKDLTNEIRDMSLAIAKGYSGGKRTADSPMVILGGVAAIIFGTAVPLHNMITNNSSAIGEMESRQDDFTDRERDSAKQDGKMEISLAEIQTQFEAIGELQSIEHRYLSEGMAFALVQGRESGTVETDMLARVRTLEKIVWPETNGERFGDPR